MALEKSLHHSFDIELATKYGVNEAILIHHFRHWIEINKKLKRNLHENRTWTYQTLDEIAAHFPYLSKSEVFEIIERLCTGKGRRSKKAELDFEPVLMKGNFNKSHYDRTVWYAFCDDTILAQAKIENGLSQNQNRLEPTPIPDALTDTKTYNLSLCISPSKEEEKKKTREPREKRKKLTLKCELSNEDREKLEQEFGKHALISMITRIEDWIEMKGKEGYASWNLAIRQWFAKEKEGFAQNRQNTTIQSTKTKAIAQQSKELSPEDFYKLL